MRLIYDTPLSSIKQDRFGRGPIVDLIVKSIDNLVSSNHPCMVYGIYGKWGEGKTSLLNFIKDKLLEQGKEDGITLVEYHPWLVNNDESLLTEFFSSLLIYPDEEVQGLLKKYGSLAVLASKTIVNAFVPGVGTALAEGIEMAQKAVCDCQNTLAEQKKRVSDAIIKSKRHLVVMIDDVDRLDKDELHAVLRLIRQVADFPNSIYIVAMDIDMVAKAIGDYHGGGTIQDGRKFIDKIVQVPISLPQIPTVEMKAIIKEDLPEILNGFTEASQIPSIVDSVSPFFETYREFKRFCNQISFVLPHLYDEVNIKDLCMLEAIKVVSSDSYNRIYDKREYLFHEVDRFQYLVDKDKETEATERRYQEAKEEITKDLSGRIKETVMNTLDVLFADFSHNHQDDLDKKRINTNEYFTKYFSQKVPADTLPDKWINELKRIVEEGQVKAIADKFNEWRTYFSVNEIRRASLSLIHMFPAGKERSYAASIIARALSVCEIACGLPYHIESEPNAIASFVSISVICPNMFIQMPDVTGVHVIDESLLDETLSTIFSEAELSFCLNMLYSADGVFRNGCYEGKRVLTILFGRFSSLGFLEQFKYSKELLITLFKYWQRVDLESFNAYAMNLFTDVNIPYLLVLDKIIDGTDDAKDSTIFVKLFYVQIPAINQRLDNESIDPSLDHHSVKIYRANYPRILHSDHHK